MHLEIIALKSCTGELGGGVGEVRRLWCASCFKGDFCCLSPDFYFCFYLLIKFKDRKVLG